VAQTSVAVSALGLAALLILAYLALEHSGGVRQIGQSASTVTGAVGRASSGLVKTFQGR